MSASLHRSILALAFGVVLAHGAAGAVFDVQTFGAKGDGVAKDTAAIQRAIDAATAAGGGTVRLGAGTYLSGSIYLKSNVDFFLDHGATLKGSPDKEDYNAVDVCPQNAASKAESASGAHLVLCIEQTNVTVRGTGRIEGNSPAFLVGPDGKNWPGYAAKIPWRPSQMVFFVECDSIRLEGVSLIDSPYWSCFLHGCTRVTVRNLLIRTRREPVHTHNGDGLDIDCCEDVEVTGCDIDTADDCITLRANVSRLKRPRPCRNVRISDCRLSSPCNGVRLGVGGGKVQDAVLRNLTVRDTRTAVDFVSSWSRSGEGVSFENVLFENMDVECRLFCRIYPRYCRNAYFKGIRFARVKGVAQMPSWVTGRRDRPVDDVTFEDVSLPQGVKVHNAGVTIKGGTLQRLTPTPEEAAAYDKGIDEKNAFPGGVRIGGTVRGGTAFGGQVKLPVRGLCAHQGDMQHFPGNTAEALLSAARKGAAMVEFDVQRCRTGEFVLMHDPTLDRLTTGTGRVRDHSLAELKTYTYRRFPERACRIPTLDEALDVLPDGGILINVHCYAGHAAMGDIARHLAARGRLHQAFVCANLKEIDAARAAAPAIAADNIQRPGPRNRDWTDEECAKFVADAAAHRCQYLQLSRPWARRYSDDAHAAGVKVIHFHSEDPAALGDLMRARAIDFVMTNHLDPMGEAFRALGLDMFGDTERSESK